MSDRATGEILEEILDTLKKIREDQEKEKKLEIHNHYFNPQGPNTLPNPGWWQGPWVSH